MVFELRLKSLAVSSFESLNLIILQTKLFSEKKRTAYSAETIRKRIPIPGIEPE